MLPGAVTVLSQMHVNNYCPEGALQCLACQTAKDNLWAVNTDCAAASSSLPQRTAVQATCGGEQSPAKKNLAGCKTAHMRARKQTSDPRHALRIAIS